MLDLVRSSAALRGGLWAWVALALVVAALLTPVVARRVGVARWRAAVVLVGAAVPLAATLGPSIARVDGRLVLMDGGARACAVLPEVSGLAEVFASTHVALNLVLLAPLGLGVALLPAPWRGRALAAAVALPVVVEAIQWAVPALGRVCSTTDVVANLVGLGAGLLVGATLVRLTGRAPDLAAPPG